MKKLETNFRSGGLDHNIVQRDGDIVLASTLREDGSVRGYIVFRTRKFVDRTIMDNFSGARESVPPAESWGEEGWTFSGSADTALLLTLANKRFAAEVKAGKFTDLIDLTPTGGQRGRTRDAFELDLSKYGSDEFLFVDVESDNAGQESYMLRNRLTALVNAGTVKIVNTIKTPGAKGKPKNVYQTVG